MLASPLLRDKRRALRASGRKERGPTFTLTSCAEARTAAGTGKANGPIRGLRSTTEPVNGVRAIAVGSAGEAEGRASHATGRGLLRYTRPMMGNHAGSIRWLPAGLCLMAVLAIAVLTGCGGGLKLTAVRTAQEKPSNVAVYFKVDKSNGDPVGGLKAEDFKIYEDGSLVSQFESKQTILNPTVAASHYTLLLIDMSGSIAESGNSQAVVDAATAFTENVEKYQKVGVYAFDGSENLYTISPFTNSGAQAKASIKTLATFKPKDPSTNLNGAVMKALQELQKELSHAEHPMRFGTLVVFTDGTDRAGRVKKEDMTKSVKDSEYDVFAIGLGAEIKEHEIKEVGKNGTAMAADKASVTQAFDSIAKKIEGQTKRYYLLSYCSPARAGEHEVTIEAIYKDEKNSQHSGKLTTKFDASGFAGGCDPNKAPNFDTSKGDALAPKDKDKEKKPAAAPSGGGQKPKPAGNSGGGQPVKPGDDFNP